MIDTDLKNKPVVRIPKTDLIRAVVTSPEWSAAINRRLIAPYPARLLESVLSIQSLRETIVSPSDATEPNQRQLMIVQTGAEQLAAISSLAVENSLCRTPALLLVIGSGLQAAQRHGLRCSGVAAIFESFIELEAMEQMVTRYFGSLPDPAWSLEQRIAKSI